MKKKTQTRAPYRRVLPPEFIDWREKTLKLLNAMVEERGFTQGQIADAAHCCQTTVGNLLRGETRDPWSSTFFKVARAIGLEIRLSLSGAHFKKVPPKVQKAIPPPKNTPKADWMSEKIYRQIQAMRN